MDHNHFMKQAYLLAKKAKGKTSPNPMVGALVVKAGNIVGRGYHIRAGQPHAEITALSEAAKFSKGATLYVTLEPCVHFGRTPPCVNSIIRSGIKKVVIGMLDPNPIINGRGVEALKKSGIEVEVGFLQQELKQLNESFIKYIVTRLPFITVKAAESLDGRIATHNGDSKWITSDKSRILAHRMRAKYDAVMVGVNTVIRDDPRLDAWFLGKQPAKIVIDSQLSTPENAKIFSNNSDVIIVTLPSKPGLETENRKILTRKARILEVKEKNGQVNLRDAMRKLAKMKITSIFCEGGGTLIGSLFDEQLVDKVVFFISPKIIGGKDAISSVMGSGVTKIDRAVKVKDMKLRRIGDDILIEGYIK
ncbi:MAG: bifunctional diaminohydroxyphosphoribosylaminopyrimidine deaminase/5-amino-6-(5-phosphoribosylamino)uracil reductase RibD [Candidatus Omnitrophota bacterium]|nr:MAG: bifunctional diaminohydroxyphosphoribosylaminopyrimidine deaminase/5-amino-6-(5-phosphoribosylamino)uracil reductase RibD [Candidatus Omnitrophota bacterium]